MVGPLRKGIRMDRETPRSTARIAKHPIHPILVPFPIVCFVGTLLTDLTYWRTADMMWADFSAWLVTVGVIMGWLAAGLRNPNGLSFEPESGALWTVVNERDELGPNLVPDYMTSVKDGGFYGWPYSYWGQHLDPRVQPQRPELVEKAIVPDYALSSHVAPLGLAFYTADGLPQKYRGGAFVGEHGSWDRYRFNGYKVAFVPFSGGRSAGNAPEVVNGVPHS